VLALSEIEDQSLFSDPRAALYQTTKVMRIASR